VVASHPATAAARQMQALSIMAAFLELAAVAARAEIYARGTGHESGRLPRELAPEAAIKPERRAGISRQRR
jgi:hypothetical protein